MGRSGRRNQSTSRACVAAAYRAAVDCSQRAGHEPPTTGKEELDAVVGPSLALGCGADQTRGSGCSCSPREIPHAGRTRPAERTSPRVVSHPLPWRAPTPCSADRRTWLKARVPRLVGILPQRPFAVEDELPRRNSSSHRVPLLPPTRRQSHRVNSAAVAGPATPARCLLRYVGACSSWSGTVAGQVATRAGRNEAGRRSAAAATVALPARHVRTRSSTSCRAALDARECECCRARVVKLDERFGAKTDQRAPSVSSPGRQLTVRCGRTWVDRDAGHVGANRSRRGLSLDCGASVRPVGPVTLAW